MRIAVAGTGSIGRRHISNLRDLLPDFSCVLLRRNSCSDSYAQLLNAEVVTCLTVALQQPLDALLVATPSDLHAELVLQGLDAGLAMYIEKPIVSSAVQLSALESHPATATASPITQSGCNLRFLPSLLRLRELLREGAIGRVVRASFEAGQWLPDWRPHQNHRHAYSANPQRGGGVLLDLIHEIDAARWLLGELTPLACTVAQVPSLEITAEGVAVAQLSSCDGALVQIGLDYVARRPLRRYQFIGDRGTLTWDLAHQTLLLEFPDGQKTIDCGHSCFDVAATYRMAMHSFLAALRGEAEPMQPLCDGLASAALAIALKEMACQIR